MQHHYFNVGSYEGDTTSTIGGGNLNSRKPNIVGTFHIAGRNSSFKDPSPQGASTLQSEKFYKYQSRAFNPSNPSPNALVEISDNRIHIPGPYGDGYPAQDAYGSGCNQASTFMDGRPYEKRYHPATLGTRSSPTYVGDWGVRQSSITNSYPYPPQSTSGWCGSSF